MTGHAVVDIDEQQSLEFLAGLVRTKSYCHTEGEVEIVRRVVDELKALGLEAEMQPIGDSGRYNAIARWPGTGGGASLLFNGHLDTNPVTEGWTVDPWGGLVDDHFIYGIGVSNMKAGCAAYFCAVRELVRAGVRLKGDVILSFVVGELQGGVGTVSAIEKGLRADYFINAEPSDLRAITMHTAALKLEIELEGVTRHMSRREDAVDALAAGAELIQEINGMTFSGAKSEVHRGINRAHIGIMHGALGRELLEWRPPQVADFVRMRGSARYAPGQTADQVRADLRALLDGLEQRHPGLKATLVPPAKGATPSMPPFEQSPGSPIVKALNRAYETVRGTEQPTGALPPTCYFGTDAGHLGQIEGMEGVVCGPGGRYNTMPDERVDRADYLDMIRVYMLTIQEICGAGD